MVFDGCATKRKQPKTKMENENENKKIGVEYHVLDDEYKVFETPYGVLRTKNSHFPQTAMSGKYKNQCICRTELNLTMAEMRQLLEKLSQKVEIKNDFYDKRQFKKAILDYFEIVETQFQTATANKKTLVELKKELKKALERLKEANKPIDKAEILSKIANNPKIDLSFVEPLQQYAILLIGASQQQKSNDLFDF